MKETLLHELRLVYSTKEQLRTGKRLPFLDMARGFAIILVVLGHCDTINLSWNTWLSTIHLPIFFIISGILMGLKKEEQCPFSSLLLQKAKHIMVPYFYFSLGSLCLDFLQILRGRFAISTLWNHFLQTISLQGYSVLWFLPVLFLAEILLTIVYKVLVRCKCLNTTCLFIILLCMTVAAAGGFYAYHRLLILTSFQILVKVLFAAAFISYGYLLSNFLTKIEFADHKGFYIAAGVFLFAVNIFAVPYVSLMNLNLLQLSNPWIYILLGITGGTGCLLLFRSIPNIPLLTFWGRNSLIIMCTHVNFYIMYCSILLNLNLFPGLTESSDAAYIILTLAGTMVLSVPVILVIRIFFPFVLGQK